MTDIKHKHWSFDVAEPVAVELDWPMGEVRLVAVDTRQITVEVEGDAEDATSVELVEGGRLRLAGPRGKRLEGLRGLLTMFTGTACDAVVTVPRGSSLRYEIGSADLRLDGEWGDVTGRSGSGELFCERAEHVDVHHHSGDVEVRDVGGDIAVRTGSGEITLGLVGGAARAMTGSGDLTVEAVLGRLEARTGSGDVTVRRAEAGGTVGCGSGEIVLGDVAAPLKAQAGSGDITVTRLTGAGDVELQAASGDVDLGVALGLKVWTDLHTVNGDIDVDLTPRGEAEPGEPFLSVSARTVSGDQRVHDA